MLHDGSLTHEVHEHRGAATCMVLSPRRLLALALSGLGVAVAALSIQRSEWMLTFAASSMSIAFFTLLYMGSSPSDVATHRATGASGARVLKSGAIESGNSDLPDPLEHGFDMPF